MISTGCVKISTDVSTAVEKRTTSRAAGSNEFPTASKLLIRGISICQPFSWWREVFRPNNARESNTQVGLMQPKKTKKKIKSDASEIRDWRGFQRHLARRSASSAGAQSISDHEANKPVLWRILTRDCGTVMYGQACAAATRRAVRIP